MINIKVSDLFHAMLGAKNKGYHKVLLGVYGGPYIVLVIKGRLLISLKNYHIKHFNVLPFLNSYRYVCVISKKSSLKETTTWF
jgi:hypothetical protein